MSTTLVLFGDPVSTLYLLLHRRRRAVHRDDANRLPPHLLSLKDHAVMSRCPKSLFEQLYRTFKGFPCVMTTRHIAGVKTRISQGGSALATDVKAIHAERHHGYFLRQ